MTMKLYFYTNYFPPSHKIIESEGTRKAVHGLASGFVSSGIAVKVLCEGDEDGSFEMPEGYTIQCFAKPKKGQALRIAPGLKQFIRQDLDSNSLVILSGIFQPRLYLLSTQLRKFGVPYVVLPHDPYSPTLFSKNSTLKWIYWYAFEQQVLKHAKAVQVLDIRHAEYLRWLRLNTPAIAVPNGFLPTDVYPEESFTWSLNGPAKLFFLGRMDAHNKGLDLLLDAFAQVVETVDAKLTIQGVDKGDRKSLEDKAEQLALSSRTAFLSPDYDTATPLLIKNYDIFCLPSRFEGFGLSALEAMLAGRVLLVSEIAGIAPHIQASGCGIVVAPEVSAIKSGLIELLQRRSEWKEMGLNGRHYALNHLRWEAIASAALDQYQKLIG